MSRKDELLYVRKHVIDEIDDRKQSLVNLRKILKETDDELKQLLKEEYQEVLRNVTEGRKKFIYDNGYGLTTDIYMLPVGIKFRVVNGMWDGEIIEEDGKKMILVEGKTKGELREDYDYCLVIRVEGVDDDDDDDEEY